MLRARFSKILLSALLLAACGQERTHEQAQEHLDEGLAGHVRQLLFTALRSAPPDRANAETRPAFRWLTLPDGTRAPALVGPRFDFAVRHERPAGGVIRARIALLPANAEPAAVEVPGITATFRVRLRSIPEGRQETVWTTQLWGNVVETVEVPVPESWTQDTWVTLEAELDTPQEDWHAAWVDPALEHRHPPPAEPATDAPSLVLLTLDTTRQDVLGVYGGPAATPTLNALAADGILFHNVFSVAFGTTPSHASLLTASPAVVHGVYTNDQVLHPRHLTLAELLHDAGYRTAAFVSAAPLQAGLGLGQGFDLYDDVLVYDPRHRLGRMTQAERDAATTIDRALTWLHQQPEDAPFFLWIHLYDPHQPYAPPGFAEADPRPFLRNGAPSFVEARRDPDLRIAFQSDPERIERLRERGWARYLAEIEAMDREIGRLVAQVDARAERSLIAVVADHGESFGEHKPDLMFDHTSLRGVVSRLPTILRLPENEHAGRAHQLLAGSLDLAPTLVALLGLDTPPNWAGRSFHRLLGDTTGRADRFRPHLLLESSNRHAVAVRTPRWMYRQVVPEFRDRPHVLNYLGYAPGRPEELYDLEADPGEMHDLLRLGEPPEELEELRRQALDLVGLREQLEGGETLDSEAHREALQALGYLD